MRLRPWRELKREEDWTKTPEYWRGYAQEVMRSYDEQTHQIALLRAALEEAREELARWGWGDFHYGSTGQEKSVTDALAKIDVALGREGAQANG